MRNFTLFILFSISLIISNNSYGQSAKGPNQWNQFSTSYGYIKMGPSNFNWAEIYTNIDKFLFNKDIYTLNGFGFSSYTNSPLLFKTGGITKMTILNSSGNVGIGTLDPTERFEVEGNSIFNGSLFINHTVTDPWQSALSITVQNDHTRAFKIKSSSGEIMFNIYGNGVVNAKRLCAEEVEVRVNAMDISWPDYVFDFEYNLLPLADLKTFIDNNKHLPEVPSERTVIEKGIKLGEMNAILLKKIEELTLYILLQQQDIEELKQILISN
jgi:hypothetical protein